MILLMAPLVFRMNTLADNGDTEYSGPISGENDASDELFEGLDENYHGYVPTLDEERAPERTTKDNTYFLTGAGYPSSYDSRSHNRATAPRSQYPYGACWSFASLASMEGSLLSRNLHGNPDLSERHLIRYAFWNVGDPIGGTNSDILTYNGSNYMYEGGNLKTYYHILANWKGAVSEDYVPYTSNAGSPTIDDAYYHDIAHLQNFYRINMTDTQDVKQAIMDYGVVTNALYSHLCFIENSTGGYYTGQHDGSLRNHTISIIGWDDNYSRYNFRLNPGRDGAWLVKDSLGPYYGQYGFMWVSYAEGTLDSTACVFVADSANNYDNNYQYDGSFLDAYCGLHRSTPGVASVYKVTGKKKQKLRAVSFDLESAQVGYQIQIYQNLSNPGNPTSGRPVLTVPLCGTTKYSGYYTVALPDHIYLNPNRYFSVVITFTPKADSDIVIREEASGTWNNTTFRASAQPNQSFYRYGTNSWMDYGAAYGENLRIKAFTDNTNLDPGIEPNGIGLNYDTLKLNRGETRTLKATLVPANVTEKSVFYDSSNPGVATVDENGVVRAVSPGQAVITGTTVNNLKSKCVVTVVINPESIRLNEDSATMYFGDSLKLTAAILPSDATEKSIIWSVSDKSIASVNNGTVKVWGAGKITVTATTVNRLVAKCEILILSEDNIFNPFADIKSGTWQYDAARAVFDDRLMTGKGELIPGKVIFSPNTTIKRAHIVQSLYNADKSPEVEYDAIFSDVPKGQWFTSPVMWASKNGIAAGKGEKFDVNKEATREEIALMLYKFAIYKNCDVSLDAPADLSVYSDAGKIHGWANDAICWAVSKGILSGKGKAGADYRLDPWNSATRIECAAMLNKLMKMYPEIMEGNIPYDPPTEPIPLPEEDEEEIGEDTDALIPGESEIIPVDDGEETVPET